MDKFVPADWADAIAPSCDQDDGLVELLCGGHVVMPTDENEAAPWFEYPVDDGSLEMELLSDIFGEMQATDAGRPAESASDAMSYRAASKTSKQKQRNTAKSSRNVMQEAEGSDSTAGTVTTCGPAQRLTTGKRRRAAQEHNLSERRRRDRINEKMRALQELIPHCNKTDKASMLDEAIDYLKSLQLLVQMMWTTGGGMPALAPATFLASSSHRHMRSRMPPFSTH